MASGQLLFLALGLGYISLRTRCSLVAIGDLETPTEVFRKVEATCIPSEVTS